MTSLFVRQAARARRAARQRGLRADLSLYEWMNTVIDFGGRCAYCDRRYRTLDHFVPLVAGGPTSIGNCIPSCKLCNNLKGRSEPSFVVFVPQERIHQIRLYLERRQQGLRGWPPSHERVRNNGEQEAFIAKKEGDTMSTKSMQWTSKTLANGKKILLYSDTQQVVLQLRSQVASEEDVVTPSFRVAVSLTPAETVTLATDLLRAASPQIDQMQVDRTQETEGNENNRALSRPAWQI